MENLKRSGEILDVESNPTFPKAIGAIQVKEVHGELTLADRKALNWLLFNAFDEIGENTVHEASLSDLRSYVSPKHKSNERIVESTKRLATTILHFDYIGTDGSRKWGTGSFMTVSGDEATDTLKYEFPHWLRPLLAEPAKWARLSLQILQQFSSKYSTTLYENLETVANLYNPEWNVTVEDFRAVLGIEEGKLKSFDALNKRAILPALKEINEHADFTASCEVTKRQGRKITKIKFTVKKKDERQFIEDMAKKPKRVAALKLEGKFSLRDDTYDKARMAAPMADVYLIESDWREWLHNKNKPMPKNPDAAFIKFCSVWYKNRQGNFLF